MAEGFPSTYVDPQSGEVRQLGSFWDKLGSDYLPKAADYALTAGKIGLLATAAATLSPVLAIGAIAAPVGIWLAERATYKSAFNEVYEKSLDQTKSGGEQYDMATPMGQAKFDRHFGDRQPTFGEDYVRMVKMAGLKTVPTIIVREDLYNGWGRFSRSQDEYNAGAASRTDGTRASIEIGTGVIDAMTPGELRAIIGHEITHLALGHTKDRPSWLARHMPSMLLSAALVGAAVFGVVPLLPAFVLVGVSAVASTCLESINSRRREELCDRGAAILTGGTADLASGLRKLKTISTKMLEQQVKEANAMSILLGRGKGKIVIKKPGMWDSFMHGTHPPTERRAGLLEAFENKYHQFCEKQRSQFRDTFNARAARPARVERPSASQGFKSVKRYPGGVVVIMRHPKPAYGGGY